MRLVDVPGLRAKGISYSRPHLRRLEAAGKFPKRVYMGEGRVAWVESEIDAWLEEKLADRHAAKARQSEAKLSLNEKMRRQGKTPGKRRANPGSRPARQSTKVAKAPTAAEVKDQNIGV